MEKLNQWVATRVERAGPSLVAFVLVVLSIVLAACGGSNGGGSGY